MAHLYSVTLTPVRDVADELGNPKEIAFLARCQDAPEKRWNLAAVEVVTVLADLFSPRDVSQIVAYLRLHESITLPRIYGPTELVQMGYRIRL
jgi:hypothetical protein